MRAEGERTIIGDDRQPDRLLRHLHEGRSLLVFGSRGSGKSYLARALATLAEDAGWDPLVLRTGAVLCTVPFGAADACGDKRLEALRGTGDEPGQPVLIVVDDAHLLDEQTAQMLVRAAYRGTAKLVLTVTVPRARAAGHIAACDQRMALFEDMWNNDLAERVDLHELTDADAREMVRAHPTAGELDAAALARCVALADGSRALLREMLDRAVDVLRNDADPLDGLRDIPAHGRLGDTIRMHVTDLAPVHRICLAVLGHLPGLSATDAARFLPPTAVQELVAAGLIHDDGRLSHGLTANTVLAREAGRQVDPDSVDAILRAVSDHLLAPEGDWWSRPAAAHVAARWLHSGGTPPHTVPDERRDRVVLDAARAANDAGDPVLAKAYLAMASDTSTEEVILENRHAEAMLERRPIDFSPGAHGIASADVILRFLTLQPQAAIDACPRPDESETAVSARATLDVTAAQRALMSMQWHRAEARAARAARASPNARVRLGSALTHAMSLSMRGCGREAALVLTDLVDAHGWSTMASTVETSDRLVALCAEVMSRAVAGESIEPVRGRFEKEAIRASRENAPSGPVWTGWGAALIYALSGEIERALREIATAHRRSAHLPRPPWAALVTLTVAREAALTDHPDAARTLVEWATGSTDVLPLLVRHTELMTTSCIAAAEGDIVTAIDETEQALEIAVSSGAALLVAADGFQRAVLGGADSEVLRLLRETAETTDAPIATALSDRAHALALGELSLNDRDVIALLRAHQATPKRTSHAAGSSLFPVWTPLASDVAREPVTAALTPREREIAELVSDGLSNRAIAEQLFLSIRNVESHVYQARAKLGARSRTHLGTIMRP